MLVAQMSDLHFCAKNLEESNRTFGFSVDDAIRRNVAAAIITGDSTDHALDAHDPALIALARHIKRLADHCPVLMLQGTFSHEPPGLLKVFQLIGAKYPVQIADKIGVFGLNETGFVPFVQGQAYSLVVTAFPTVNKADLVAALGAVDSNVMGDTLSALLGQFAPMHAALKKAGVPTMLIGHGTVQDCMTEHGVPMAGMDHEFGTGALFAARCDVVALGHIHKHQVWTRATQVIAYAGSIGRFHHGEEGDKHYLVWDMAAEASSFEAVVTPSRKTIDLFFEGLPDMAVIADAAATCAGAYVRVRYCVDEESRQFVNRAAIKAVLSEALDIQIEGKTLVIERQRAAGISTAPSVAQKLVQWCEITKSDSTPLMERLSQLQTMDAYTIASAMIERIKNENENGKPKCVESAPASTVEFAAEPSEPACAESERVLCQDSLFA